MSQCSRRESKKRSPSLCRRLELYLPKFSIEGSYQLEEVLPKLGIRDIFTSDADLTGISNHSTIRVSEVSPEAPERLLPEMSILFCYILFHSIHPIPHSKFFPSLSHLFPQEAKVSLCLLSSEQWEAVFSSVSCRKVSCLKQSNLRIRC